MFMTGCSYGCMLRLLANSAARNVTRRAGNWSEYFPILSPMTSPTYGPHARCRLGKHVRQTR